MLVERFRRHGKRHSSGATKKACQRNDKNMAAERQSKSVGIANSKINAVLKFQTQPNCIYGMADLRGGICFVFVFQASN